MVITLDEAKLYLKVDGEEDNALITSLITAAEEMCQGILRMPLSNFTVMPETVKQAILYAISNLYEQRDAADIKTILGVMTRMLFAYRMEGW